MSSLLAALTDFSFSGCEVDAIHSLRVNGSELAKTERKALIERVQSGEFVELEIEANTYIQRETPNRNFVRFKDGTLSRFAKTGMNTPFLIDHNKRNVDSRGGTVVKSKLVRGEDGEKSISQTILLTKPWAVVGVLDGTIDRFSIGFMPTGPILYSHNKEEIDGWPKFWPGDVLEDGTVVEWIFTEAELIETSGVNVPAVVGTQIDGVREALQLALGEPPKEKTKTSANKPSGKAPRKVERMSQIAKMLGLSEDASQEEIAAALSKQQEETKSLKDKNSKLEAANEIQRLASESTQVELEIDAALKDGRLTIEHGSDGKRVHSVVETKLRKYAAEHGLEFFLGVIKGLPAAQSRPMPATSLQSASPAPAGNAPGMSEPVTELDSLRQGNPHIDSVLKQLGISEEEFAKYSKLEELPPSLMQ